MGDATRGSQKEALVAVSDEDLAAAIADWLPSRRWYAGKGRRITGHRTLARVDLPGQSSGQYVVHLVVGVELDGQSWQVYQVPLLVGHDLQRANQDPPAAQLGDFACYDALGDVSAPRVLVSWTADSATVNPEQTHGGGERRPQLQALWDPGKYLNEPARALSVEQSNTSVRFGTVALMKVFRRLTPGVNPDVEVSAALARVGCADIAQIWGWVNGGWSDPCGGGFVTGHLGMVQELLTPAVDGWDVSRDRVAAGVDFAEDSYRLGLATGSVHRDLRSVLPTRVLDAAEVLELAGRLHERLIRAAASVPEIAQIAASLHNRISAIADIEVPIRVQRVHGDFHLGQVLLAHDGWKLLDFEGEPGGAIAERRVSDHPLRDVAAMLRSYDYAANVGGRSRQPEQVRQWRKACEAAFLRGYQDCTTADPGAEGGAHSLESLRATEILLAAYTVDKAAYEAVYEKQNRPDWLPIPMAALQAIATGRND